MDFDGSPTVIAQRLIGRHLCRRTRDGLCTGRIVETEAYLSEGDSASHSVRGPNRKNACMFGPAGRAYVYTIHARQCMNVVTESSGIGSAVLIRALEPLTGFSLMQRRRRTDRLRDLCRGPARLCEAFQIGRDLDGWGLNSGSRLWIADDSGDLSADIMCSSRIGVTSAEELPLRFFVRRSGFVSGTRKQNSIYTCPPHFL